MLEVFKAVRVSLRALTLQDCNERYLRWLQDDEVNKYLEVRFNAPSTDEDLESFVRSLADDPASEIFAIEVDLNFIGTIKISDIDKDNSSCVIGYMIGDRRYWGRGIGKVAVSIAIFNIFYRLNLNTVFAGALEQNYASNRLLESVGFSLAGVCRQRRMLNGKASSEHLYGLTKSDFVRQHTVKHGRICQVVLVGGGGLLFDLAANIADKGDLSFCVCMAPRHAEEQINGAPLSKKLEDLGIEYHVVTNPSEITNSIDLTRGSMLVGIGPAWIIPARVLELFELCINVNAIPSPQYQGGAHQTWQILNGSCVSGCVIQKITRDIDRGPVINYVEGRYGETIDVDQMINELRSQLDEFIFWSITEIIESGHHVELPYELVATNPAYFPRLLTDVHGWVDWSWTAEQISKFCGGFDSPFAGARTKCGDDVVIMRSCRHFCDTPSLHYHPFSAGIVIDRVEDRYKIACLQGYLIVHLISESDIRIGSRLYTPKNILEEAAKAAVFAVDGSVSVR